MTTTFGYGMISAQHDPRDARSDTVIYADVLDLCAGAERLGFDAVWLSEHHFVDDGYMPSLLPVAAAIAARTTRIRIGTGVLIAPLHDPLRLAEDAATVDLLSAGRLVLGLGAGYRDEEFAGFGQDRAGLGAVMDETLMLLQAAWAGRPVRHRGTEVLVSPRPHGDGGPPIWLGARSGPAIRRAARRADGLLAARVSPEQFAAQVRVLDDALAAVGRDPADVTVSVHCPVFAWAGQDAWPLVEPHLFYSEWKYQDMVETPYGQRSGRPAVPPELTGPLREKLRVGALVGAPAEIARVIGAYAAGAGPHPFHFVARLYWPGMDPELMREAMAVFAAEVMPAVGSTVG
jgi:alkanesulfonate monooxygenase SsuD/methylene tetrahydromethanopterin reductase-like flavin-dependent oxidoreductase (luciferase family)